MKTTTNLDIDIEKMSRAGTLLKAVSHPMRLKVLKLINSKNEMNVNQIYNTLKIEQSIASQHLKMLRDAQVVDTRREGKKIFYFINHNKLGKLNQGVDKFGLEGNVGIATKSTTKKRV